MSEPMSPEELEAIRARLDAATARDVGPDDADIDAEVDRVRSARMTMECHAPYDLRRLLDRADSLLAHNGELVKEIYFQAGRADEYRAELATMSERSTGYKAELDRVIREAAADKARLSELTTLQDRIPDDTNGPFGRGWDKGYNAALEDVRAMAAPGMPYPPTQDGRGDAETPDSGSGTGTGVVETPGTAQGYEAGRRIAVSMMDRAEAKHRHEHGQPHLREHCETCAEEYWAERLRSGHYREAANGLRGYAAGRHVGEPYDSGFVDGITSAADRLDSYARDLPSLPVPGEEA